MMVWALIEPSSFGDFFPEGEFKGRKEQMAEYFGQMPADFQAKFNGSVASYKNYAYSKFTHEIGDKLGEKPPITSMWQVYPDYIPDGSKNQFGMRLAVNQPFMLQMRPAWNDNRTTELDAADNSCRLTVKGAA